MHETVLIAGIVVMLAIASALDIRNRKVPLELWVLCSVFLVPFSLEQYSSLPQWYLLFMVFCTVTLAIFLYLCKVYRRVGGADVVAMVLVSFLSLPVVFSVAFWLFTMAAGAALIFIYYGIAQCKEIHVPYMVAILAGFIIASQYPTILIITG